MDYTSFDQLENTWSDALRVSRKERPETVACGFCGVRAGEGIDAYNVRSRTFMREILLERKTGEVTIPEIVVGADFAGIPFDDNS